MAAMATAAFGHGDDMRVNIIENGKVVNTIVAKSLAQAKKILPSATLVGATNGKIGDLWDGSVFTPDPDLPARIILAEAKAALTETNSQAAEMLDDLITMLNSVAVINRAQLPASIKDWQTKRETAKAALKGGV